VIKDIRSCGGEQGPKSGGYAYVVDSSAKSLAASTEVLSVQQCGEADLTESVIK
jgi:hypothetical protein